MTVARPTTLDDALSALARLEATIVAGGTDVMVEVNRGRRNLGDVVAVRRVKELRTLSIDAREVRIGAALPYAEVIGPSGLPPAAAPVLYEAARSMGSTQIRQAGTLGGNVGTGSAVGDALCALLALNARATVAAAGTLRDVPVDSLLGGGLAAGELIVDVHWPLASGPQRFLKVCRRAAVSRSVVSVSVVVEEPGTVRIVIGGVAPQPFRPRRAEALAQELHDGGRFSTEAAGVIAQAVRTEVDPPSDIAGSAEYRRHAAGILVARALAGRQGARAAA